MPVTPASGALHDPMVWLSTGFVTRAAFAGAAQDLANRLPDGSHVINLCANRLAFMLGFVAAGLRGQTTLLPHSVAAGQLDAIRKAYPECHVLDDTCTHRHSRESTRQISLDMVESATAAILFTSGSTGTPQPHPVTWGTLAVLGRLDAQRLTGSRQMHLVVTVPSQHMYGLQTSALLPLFGGCSVHHGKPFFPADVATALHALPAPRVLVTTPHHLRSCLDSGVDMPPLERVISATAPLSAELAARTELRWETTLLEIFGSTEAGTIGTRRTANGELWQLLPGVRLERTAAGAIYSADHLPTPLTLNDVLDPVSSGSFSLIGRAADQVKIAGKRTSLAELNRLLLQVPGVLDGVIFVPQHSSRTAALVVAPHLDAVQIVDALIQWIDPVFLPRPLVFLDRLPRNELGKLTHAALHEAVRW